MFRTASKQILELQQHSTTISDIQRQSAVFSDNQRHLATIGDSQRHLATVSENLRQPVTVSSVQYCFILAMTSVAGSIYSFFRSIISVGFLYGICYGAMKVNLVVHSPLHKRQNPYNGHLRTTGKHFHPTICKMNSIQWTSLFSRQ